MFKHQPTETHFIWITAVLVALLAVPTLDALSEDKGIEESWVQQEVSTAEQRSPASVGPAEMKVTSAVAQLTRYDVSCAKKGSTKLDVSGGYVQFQGKNCLKNAKDGDVEIVNRSNGYTASVFFSGDDKYQTDLIQLKEGDNEIMIRYRERSGKAVEEVVQVRSIQI